MKKTAMLLLILLTFISCKDEINVITSKQPGKIVGTVLPKESVATIQLIQGEIISTTDTDNGIFQFEDVSPGIYRLSIKADNYGKQEIENIKVEDGEGNDIGVIELSKYPYPLTLTTPFDGAKNVSATSTNIRFTFSEEIDPSSVESGFSIEPNVKIIRYYSSSSNKYFYFEAALNFGTQYKVTLDTSVTTIFGEHMEFPSVLNFFTEYFILSSVTYPIIYSNSYDYLSLKFNGVPSENYEESISIDPELTIIATHNTGARYVRDNQYFYSGIKIIPVNGWIADTTFSITISKSLKEFNGANLRNDTTITFTTPPLQIIETFPLDGQHFVDTSSSIRIKPNYLLDQGTIQNAVSISPEVNYSLHTTTNNGQTIFYLLQEETFAPGTNYTVTINKSLTDIYGVPMKKDYSFSFTTKE